MMKKLSKIALLAAASAFMLAVFPACGDDDEEADPKATLTLVGDAVELETGKDNTVTATVTLENDTFSAEAKKIAAEHEIPTEFFELKATDAKVSVSAAKVKTWDSDTKATITFTVTAAEGAAAGTISAEIKKGTLSSNKTLTTAGNIAYTIKKVDQDPVPSVEIVSEATSMTVEVEGTLDLMAEVSNFPEGVTYDWKSDKEEVATVARDPENMKQARVTAVAAGTAKITVTAKSGDTEKSDEVTVTVAAKGSDGGEGIEPVAWKISDYLSDLKAENGTAKKLSELGFEDGAECGIAKLGYNVKVRSDGNGVSNTVTDGVTGYCQLSNGKAGGLLLTVPAGTVKITLGAKNTNRALAIYDSTCATALKAFTETSSDYADFVYEHTFAEETQVYVTSIGGTTNFKALKLE